jgi:hypothetical protein
MLTVNKGNLKNQQSHLVTDIVGFARCGWPVHGETARRPVPGRDPGKIPMSDYS